MQIGDHKSERVKMERGRWNDVLVEIKKWLVDLRCYFEEEDALNLLIDEEASRVFNFDETGFGLQGSSGLSKVFCRKGIKKNSPKESF
jgi:hypothetical protein